MSNRIVMGKGDVAVFGLLQEGRHMVGFQRGGGDGDVERIGQDSKAFPNGMELYDDDLDGLTCVLEFENSQSIQAVIDVLEYKKLEMLGKITTE